VVALSELLKISGHVREALDSGQAVLALESTIITHGLRYPHNLETARAAEQAVRDAGATPATIAVIDGRLKVGLSGYELERLADANEAVSKCSRRDLPFMVEQRGTAGTTVAATMIIAQMAGIRVFATGGIGGVHQGGERSMDVSADLQELAKTNVAVVCAGPKSILDIGLTREYLETHGVPVVGYQTRKLPAFYTRKSGFEADYQLDSAAAIARLLDTKWRMGLQGGVVIANPIPREFALDRKTMVQINETAIRDALEQGVAGKALTPFLLARVEELTGGKSLVANRELMLNNARLGAEIAIALNDLNAGG
jgi:pseudouridine-5'-phosphate glycosidase